MLSPQLDEINRQYKDDEDALSGCQQAGIPRKVRPQETDPQLKQAYQPPMVNRLLRKSYTMRLTLVVSLCSRATQQIT